MNIAIYWTAECMPNGACESAFNELILPVLEMSMSCRMLSNSMQLFEDLGHDAADKACA
jgi:hypothetical protein